MEQKVTRDQAKLITLCALYGQSANNLKKTLPESINPYGVIRKTRDFFNANILESMLETDMKKENLRNALGRPIILPDKDKRLLVSYFLQSSAAELSILAFSDWYEKNKESSIPLYIIHDALIVDCNAELAESLIRDKKLTLSVGDWKFEAKVTRV